MKINRQLFLSIIPIVLAGILYATSVSGQSVQRRDQLWFGFFSQPRFTERSGMWIDIHYRVNDPFHPATGIVRVAYTYFVTDHLRASAGYGHIRLFTPDTSLPDVPEHRPWQQVQWITHVERLQLSQWLRTEERFRRRVSGTSLLDDYNFNWRFRYNLGLSVPLRGKQLTAGTPFVLVNDEIHVNAGKQTVDHRFDQNRFFVGLGYQFGRHTNANIGYLNVHQKLAPTSFVRVDAVRLFVTSNIDLRQRKS